MINIKIQEAGMLCVDWVLTVGPHEDKIVMHPAEPIGIQEAESIE